MKKVIPRWHWQDGAVDHQKEHIELRHGDAGENSYEDWHPIARIGKPRKNIFPVQWLVSADSPEHQAMLADARKDLDFYLVEKCETDPWAYAQYHCNTGANMYSRVHWSYFPTGTQGERHASMVIRLSAEEAAQEFGDSREPDKPVSLAIRR